MTSVSLIIIGTVMFALFGDALLDHLRAKKERPMTKEAARDGAVSKAILILALAVVIAVEVNR